MNGTSRWMRAARWLVAHATVLGRTAFSLLALGLLALHARGTIHLDYVGILLVILIAGPWILDRIVRLKAGDWEIDLRYLRERLREVQDESAEAANTQLPGGPLPEAAETPSSIFSPADFAGLSLQLRLEIEGQIRALAAAASIGFGGGRVPLARAVFRLSEAGALPWDLAAALSDLLPALNRSVHGEDVPPDVLDWIAVAGRETVYSLSRYVQGYQAQASELELAIQDYVSSGTSARVDYRVSDVRWARDQEGVWWATALVDGLNLEIDQALAIMRKEPGGLWTGVDFGTGLEEGELPAEVRRRLWQR